MAGTKLSVSQGNTFVGADAARNLKLGDKNTFLGASAGQHIVEGESNTFLGNYAGANIKSTNASIFIGHRAGENGGQGGNNIFIGADAGRQSNNTKNNIFIGTGAGENETESNTLIIDNNRNDTPLIYGKFDQGLLRINGGKGLQLIHGDKKSRDGFVIQKQGRDSLAWRMFVDKEKGDLHLFSKQKGKESKKLVIIDSDTGDYFARVPTGKDVVGKPLPKLLQLQPIQSPDNTLGFSLKQLKEVLPSLVKQEEGSKTAYLNYTGLNMLAVQALQEQQQTIEALENQVSQLKTTNETLLNQVNILIDLLKKEKK